MPNIHTWLKKNFKTKIEYDFWYYFYDDLDDCFDDLEPWRVAHICGWDWHGWDKEFTGRRIRPDAETRAPKVETDGV